jgi:hypothetical protein
MLVGIKRKSVAAVVICAVLAAASFAFWQMNQSAQAAMVYPHPGLVGWWGFDEGSGTVAGDSSGNGNKGTIYGATWVAGKYGNALSFNGIDNSVSVPYSSTLNLTSSPWTVCCWVNHASLTSGVAQDYIRGRDTVGGAQYYLLYDTDNTMKVAFYNNSKGWTAASSGMTPAIDTWYLVVGVWDRSTLKIYVNGALKNSVTASAGPNLNLQEVDIGLAGDGRPMNGTIDEVRVYNRALSATEIQADFQIGPDFSLNVLAKVPQGTTQVITTLSWQGTGSINVTIVSPSQNYTESTLPEYQKTTYSTSSGTTSMLNIKRLSVSVNAISSDQNWYVVLTFDSVTAYQITVEVQK